MPRVLVVEPDAEVRALFSTMLRRLGHEPVVAEPGANTPPECDVVLVEPAWSAGVELVCSLRRHRPTLPVVGASIFPAQHAPAELTTVRHLEKPFTLVQLSDAIAGAFTHGPVRPV